MQRPGELTAPWRVWLSSALCRETAFAGVFWGGMDGPAGCGCAGGACGMQFNPIHPSSSLYLAGGCACPSFP